MMGKHDFYNILRRSAWKIHDGDSVTDMGWHYRINPNCDAYALRNARAAFCNVIEWIDEQLKVMDE